MGRSEKSERRRSKKRSRKKGKKQSSQGASGDDDSEGHLPAEEAEAAAPAADAAAPEAGAEEAATPPLALPKRGPGSLPGAAAGAAGTPRVLSKWCSKFLTTSRAGLVVEGSVLEDVPLDDTYMLAFSQRCSAEKRPRAPSETSSSSSSSSSSGRPEDEDDDERPEEDAEEEAAGEAEKDAAAARVPHRVFLSNVPFTTTESRLRRLCERHGVVDDVSLPVCRAGPNAGRPAGYAIVSYAAERDAADAVEALDGASFEGRDVRARLEIAAGDDDGGDGLSPDRKRRKTGAGGRSGSRYFDLDDDAPAQGRTFFGTGPRCALCASAAHLMDSCPEALCHRCLEPGHAARDCPNPRRDMPEICTACGDVGHSWKWCEAVDGEARLSAGATCMSCGKVGHLDCKKVKKPKTHDVYCAFCARAGHTEPSCPAKRNAGRGAAYRSR